MVYNTDNVFSEKLESDILRSEDMKDKYIGFVEHFGDPVPNRASMNRDSFGFGYGRESIGLGRESLGTRAARTIRN